MKWIEIVLTGESASGKTKIWEVFPREAHYTIGQIRWYASWRKYVFAPQTETVFEWDCLRDIADFCEQQTKARKHLGDFQGSDPLPDDFCLSLVEE